MMTLKGVFQSSVHSTRYILSDQKEKIRLLFLPLSCREENGCSAEWPLLPREFSSRSKVCSFAKWDSPGCTRTLLRLVFVFHEAEPKAKPAGRHCHPAQLTPNFIQFLFAFFGPAILALSWHKNSALWHLMNKITSWPESACTLGRIPKTSSCLYA